MKSVDPGKDFTSWRGAAKRLLSQDIAPEEIIWESEQGLFGAVQLQEEVVPYGAFSVPLGFVDLAKGASCHCDPGRWSLLYRILWRIVKGGERNLCSIASDQDIAKAQKLRKNVSREIHKMHAFVRFKVVASGDAAGKERYVAWFEPEHWIVEAGTPFFRKRFANMDWSIFTPKGCAHWDGENLYFTAGVERDPTGDPDALEGAWKTYYRSIFNPARLKVKAMQTEMPKRYWKNLPEADLIEELISGSRGRVGEMHAEELRPAKSAPKNKYLSKLSKMSSVAACSGPQLGQELGQMAEAVQACRGCSLWQGATSAVFGEGPNNARIMIVGEQPGDREDVAGRVFVGPAGKLLDKALGEAGIDRSEVYLTNAVKHFKWTPKETPRGKIRLHQSPEKGEIDACRPWVLGELKKVAPDVLILLGKTAARSLLGKTVAVTKERGVVDAAHLAGKVIVTVHPSFLLRSSYREAEVEEYDRFVSDLKLAIETRG